MTIKEPYAEARRFLFHTLKDYGDELRSRISSAALDQPTPARVVYWTHLPFPPFPPDGMPVTDYLGRDVISGGYLVIETDHLRLANRLLPSQTNDFLNLQFDSTQWESVFRQFIPANPEGFVLPTLQSGGDFFLQIYRRR